MSERLKWIFFALLTIWNLISFFMMGIDKSKAKKGKWRIPEKVLLISALLGGGIGSFFGMKSFRHKTKHWYFRLLLPLFAILQAILVCYIMVMK